MGDPAKTALSERDTVDAAHRDPAELLAEYQAAQAAVAEVREKLKRELEAALTR